MKPLKFLTEDEVRDWLKQKGVLKIDSVINGIDTNSPMYTPWLDVGDELIQFRDNPNTEKEEYRSGATGGQWFALPTMKHNDYGSLGIGSGLAGKTLFQLTVACPVEVLETTAKDMNFYDDGAFKGMPKLLYERFIGPGGATQIFIPDRGLSSLR